MLLLLRMKTAYLQKLPWLLAGLAHTCQETSRQIGRRILEQWMEDPRPEAHHRITAALLCPGPFMDSLQDWVAGAELQNLSDIFLRHVAAWRFAPIVETTIEEKHARVSLAKRRHHIGPVRISLANRLPLLERWVKRGHVSAKELLDFFTQCRSLKAVPSLLNLVNHPALDDEYFKRPAKMRVKLAAIMYRCDLSDMYKSHDSFAKANEKLKRKAVDQQLKLLDRCAAGALTHETVLRNAMQCHLLALHDENDGACFYSCSSRCLNLQSVSAALSEPLSKQRRLAAGGPRDEELLPPDVDICDVPSNSVTFQIVMKNPADKKVIRPSVGAGGRLSKGAVVVSHKLLSNTDALTEDALLVSPSSAAMDDLGGQFLLSGLLGNIDDIQTCMRKWNSVGLAWTLQNSVSYGFEHGHLHDLLQGMVAAGAYEMNCESLGYSALPEQLPVLQKLEQHDLVTYAGDADVRWYFTELGAQELCSCTALSKPSRVFSARENIPLHDRSAYELMLELMDRGWQWQRWVPLSKRTRRMVAAGQNFEAYARDGPKIFYSGESLSHAYLLVLLNADQYFEMGLPAIEHGREEACYKAVLKGNFERMLPQLPDLPPDIDALEAVPPDHAAGIADAVEVAGNGVPVGEEAAVFNNEADDRDELVLELEHLMDMEDGPMEASDEDVDEHGDAERAMGMDMPAPF